MKELEYPFDSAYILSKKRKIKRLLLEGEGQFIEKKVAILGGSTTDDIRAVLELFLLNEGIKPAFYESGYNQWYQDAVFDNPVLADFQPDIIYVHTTNRNIAAYPTMADDVQKVEQMLSHEMKRFETAWEHLLMTYQCPVVQNNFEMPFYRLMGNKEASDIHGAVNFLTRLNLRFYEYAQRHDNFYICDINYISADYGLREWSDPFYYYMYKYALNVNAIPYLAFNVSNIIKSVFGRNKKGFVLDLDNTLWGGIVGDAGVNGIIIGPESPDGQAYLEFQEYIRAHMQLGIVLNIDSKNDPKNVMAGLGHPDSRLCADDFIVIKANWEAKDKNFADITEELSILPESLVFLDDSPAERDIVTRRFPEVRAPRLSQVQNYICIIDRSGFFEVTDISGDDAKRNEMYRENIKREELKKDFTDYSKYLESLEMKANIRSFEPVYMARIAQLINKSNQFNLTTRRYTQAEIEAVSADGAHITLYGTLKDKFGDNGVVSIVIACLAGRACHIELWVMSCRVLKRGMENAMMDALVHCCIRKSVREIYGYYYPTAKNGMIKDFYASQGFEKIREDVNGNTEWKYEVMDGYINRNKIIEVEEYGHDKGRNLRKTE